eukprot:scaffold132256_cov30-Phaeocystis_antarctica.AAC.1
MAILTMAILTMAYSLSSGRPSSNPARASSVHSGSTGSQWARPTARFIRPTHLGWEIAGCGVGVVGWYIAGV